MKENNAIKEALRQTDIPQLPLNFSHRAMAKIESRARQRNILEQVGMWIVYIMTGVGCFAGLRYVMARYFPFDFDIDIDLSPSLPRPDFSYSFEIAPTYIYVAIIMFILLFADSYIRYRIRQASQNNSK